MSCQEPENSNKYLTHLEERHKESTLIIITKKLTIDHSTVIFKLNHQIVQPRNNGQHQQHHQMVRLRNDQREKRRTNTQVLTGVKWIVYEIVIFITVCRDNFTRILVYAFVSKKKQSKKISIQR
jgi:hypothetical protein